MSTRSVATGESGGAAAGSNGCFVVLVRVDRRDAARAPRPRAIHAEGDTREPLSSPWTQERVALKSKHGTPAGR